MGCIFLLFIFLTTVADSVLRLGVSKSLGEKRLKLSNTIVDIILTRASKQNKCYRMFLGSESQAKEAHQSSIQY